MPKGRCHSDIGEAHPDQWLVVEESQRIATTIAASSIGSPGRAS